MDTNLDFIIKLVAQVFGSILGELSVLFIVTVCIVSVIRDHKRIKNMLELLESINEKLTGKTDSNKNQTARKDGEGEKTYGRH